MKINTADGSVDFPGGTLRAAMDEAEFLASPLAAPARRISANAPYETFGFMPEPGISATVDFKDGRLLNLSVAFDLPGDVPEDRSVQRELERKRIHDEFLRRELGEPPYGYAWGRVVSAFYHQHCASEITVAYGGPA